MGKPTKRYAYPRKDFDDQFDSLVRWIETNQGSIPAVDLAGLKADVAAQRAGRAAVLTAKVTWVKESQGFAQDQAKRSRRFNTTLKVMRAALRDEPVKMAELKAFQRKVRRGAKSESPAGEEVTPTP